MRWMILLMILCVQLQATAQTSVQTNTCFGWDSVSSAKYYKIYSGTNTGVYNRFSVFTNVTGCVTGLTAGARYYFAISTVNTNGTEGVKSPEISWVAGDTNVYVQETNYSHVDVAELLVSYSHPSQFMHTGIFLTNTDLNGVVGGVLFTNRDRCFMVIYQLTNWVNGTNVVTYTNPPPDFPDTNVMSSVLRLSPH